jgi:hypothetical protein
LRKYIEVYRDFKGLTEIQKNRKSREEPCEVQGTVVDVSEPSIGICVSVKVIGADMFDSVVFCYFSKEFRFAFAELNKGDKVVIQGTFVLNSKFWELHRCYSITKA